MRTELKHDWNGEQIPIILALKEILCRRTFDANYENFFGIQRMLRRMAKKYGDRKAFYQLWEEIRSDYKLPDDYRKVCDVRKIYLAQAAFAVFTGEDPLLIRNRASHPFWQKSFFNYAHPAPVTLLPERLHDPNLLEAAKKGDLAKIVFLYDMSPNKGKKLKNITHILLNNRCYGMLMELHSSHGCLDLMTQDTVMEHLFSKNQSPGKERFDIWACQSLKPRAAGFWWRFMRQGALHAGLVPALKAGMDPDAELFIQEDLTVTLRDFLHFLDEISEEGTQIYNHEFQCLLKAAKKFVQWEQEFSSKVE